ncbi:hypothetical protein [Roseomonas populi]|uniref:Uncharacterized protein n=1 Tax=Roseomonas populi TaxID=3121582 RepID=A0ABT1X8I3_9PROT|nr:hypothetical protein [Roseomonas pecuniae]MCR0984415.1 hypothetical protein [Roseomonas pecuniae]
MITIASRAAAPIINGVGRLLFALALAGATAATTRADGLYIAGPTAFPAWTASDAARTPLAGSSVSQNLPRGGDDQYLAGPAALQAWPRTESRTPLAGDSAGKAGWNFDLTSQGG